MLLPALTPAIKLLVPAVFVVSPSAVTVPVTSMPVAVVASFSALSYGIGQQPHQL
jgi:hypothetical protein